MFFNILKLIFIINICFSLNSFSMKRENEKSIDELKKEVTQDKYENGLMYFNCGDYNKGDYKRALQCFLPLAQQGHIDAQYYVGYMYYKGLDMMTNHNIALQYFMPAAQQGHAKAQYYVGYIYYKGYFNCPHDYTKAIHWLKLAAEQNHLEAQGTLGEMYYFGQGVNQNYEEAFKWLLAAALKAHPRAQYNLGVMYYNGKGVDKNSQEGLKWILKAAKQNFVLAQIALAKIYLGTKRFDRARKWQLKAIENCPHNSMERIQYIKQLNMILEEQQLRNTHLFEN